MSIFAINHLCREDLVELVRRCSERLDRLGVIRIVSLEQPIGKRFISLGEKLEQTVPLDLTDHERSALLAGDVGALYRMGVNAFLMNYLARFEVCGLNGQIYNERMRAVRVDEIGNPVG